MRRMYETKATVTVNADDATYTVSFETEYRVGRTWEFNPMSDAVGQDMSQKTGNIRVVAEPQFETMKFPEDWDRPSSFVVKRDTAVLLYKQLPKRMNYWFFLDMCQYYDTLTDEERAAMIRYADGERVVIVEESDIIENLDLTI